MSELHQLGIDGTEEKLETSEGYWEEQPESDKSAELPPELASMLNEVNRANQREGIPDFSKFREESRDSWTELVEGDSFPEMLLSLLKQTILLPRADFQIPIAASYLMLNSAMCSRVPILYSHGLSGSGKSTLGHIACKIHLRESISAGSTAASLRNDISNGRYHDPDLKDAPGNEKPWALVWEDISRDELKRQEGIILSMLKNGTERSGTITIAQLGGTNVAFHVFSPKYISSIHPLYAEYEFRELIRRIIVVQHKPFDRWTADDSSEFYQDIEPSDLIDINDVDTKGLKQEFVRFWSNTDVLVEFSSISKSLGRTRKHGIPDAYYKMSRDLIATGLVCGYWDTREKAIAHLREYWEWHEDNIASQMGATQKVLKRFIEERTKDIEVNNQKFLESGLEFAIKPLELSPKEVKDYVSMCASNGELDTNVNARTISDCMANIGWKLTINAQGVTVWSKILQ